MRDRELMEKHQNEMNEGTEENKKKKNTKREK